MSNWKILPQERDSAMVNYSKYGKWGEGTSWHGNTIEYLKQVYNKTTFRGCVDVGASYGFLSVPFSFMFEKVYSFEPNPGVIECLEQNILSRDNIEVYGKALSNKSGSFHLEVPREVSGAGQVHLEEPQVNNTIHPVEVITLDSLNLVDIDFIKIDVEGHELELIEGAIQTIQKYRPVIYCEVHSHRSMNDYYRRRKIIGFFEDLGYKFHDVRYHDYTFLPM